MNGKQGKNKRQTQQAPQARCMNDKRREDKKSAWNKSFKPPSTISFGWIKKINRLALAKRPHKQMINKNQIREEQESWYFFFEYARILIQAELQNMDFNWGQKLVGNTPI